MAEAGKPAWDDGDPLMPDEIAAILNRPAATVGTAARFSVAMTTRAAALDDDAPQFMLLPDQEATSLHVVAGDMVRRPHWDRACALMVTSAGSGWFLAMHYRLNALGWVPVHATRKVWPQDGDWVAA